MEDPERKILDWCGHLSVPIWQTNPEKCHACNAKFGMFTPSHNCRLCGYFFCNACTSKMHVPLMFRVKHKDGPARVCVACIEGCMNEKRRVENLTNNPQQRAPAQSTTQATLGAAIKQLVQEVILQPPLTWESTDNYIRCPKCSTVKNKGKHHNCRTCGLLHCNNCTSKMDIPAYFERKAGKKGAARVCDTCRFKIVQGAKFKDRPVSINQLSRQQTQASIMMTGQSGIGGDEKETKRSDSLLPLCAEQNCSSPALSTSSFCSIHQPLPPLSIDIVDNINGNRWELTVKTGVSTSLAALDVLFRRMYALQMKYDYIYATEPIPDMYMDIFTLANFPTYEVEIRRREEIKEVEDEEDEDEDEKSSAPFKRASILTTLSEPRATRTSTAAIGIKKEIVNFKTPGLAAGGWSGVVGKGEQVARVSVIGTVKGKEIDEPAVAPPALDIESTLRERARMYFGAN